MGYNVFVNLEILPLIVTSGLAFMLLTMMSPLAHYLGLVDHPTARKNHVGQIPLTGGIAIYTAVLLGSLVFDIWYENSGLFFFASFLIVLLGILDDRFDLSAVGRLCCQLSVASIMVMLAQNSVTNLGDLVGSGEIRLVLTEHFFTIICVVGVVNAFNMIDGIDGLAGGISLIVLTAVIFLLLESNNSHLIMTPMMMIAAIVPFLAFNLSMKGFKGNKVFMGDSGSMFVGLTIAWLMVDFTQSGTNNAIRPITAVWIVGLPLLDMAAIMYRRLRKGESMLKPDRQHLHNIFMRAGLSSRRALVAILVMGLICALIGVLGELYNIAEYVMFALFMITLVVYSFVLQNVWVILRIVRRSRFK
jgi:UDP-GlcNAc:undecaprenyl-phosphate GlcNAc-1-phosphate transferase